MRPKSAFYDTVLFALTLATFLTMSLNCNAERSAYITHERLFEENCTPSNAFFLFYLLMCLMLLIRPVENLFLLLSPTLGAQTISIKVQARMLSKYTLLICALLIALVILGMAISFMHNGYVSLIDGIFTLFGASLLPDETIQFYRDGFWLWSVLPLLFNMVVMIAILSIAIAVVVPQLHGPNWTDRQVQLYYKHLIKITQSY